VKIKRGIFSLKTSKTQILDPIITILKEVKEVAEFALLFGSMKTGRILPESDIDMLVVLKDPFEALG
jgi:predicted nucleotidyltransferase